MSNTTTESQPTKQAKQASQTKLGFKEELNRLRTLTQADKSQQTFSALIVGQVGVGKTHILSTCRMPLLLSSFDPGGSKTLRPEIEAGLVIADTRFEKDAATAFKTWEKWFLSVYKTDLFENIGTYAIDSFSTWLEALKLSIAGKKNREDGILQIQDWQVLANTIRDLVAMMSALPCDFIMTGHLVSSTDELTSRSVSALAAPNSLQVKLPILFDEIYCLITQNTSKGIARHLLTANDGKYQARTRIGRDKFNTKEEPNIKALLKKAGLPCEDLPKIGAV